ncbi:MAG: cyclic nucleotide-binding domain-containing protein [Actinobacteria bacterium]|nr:cyclic nucleotide-binding domain-containing protein [Actinomycetota bacterium]
MRVESSITSISWIPSEAIKGMVKLPFEVGAAHYDQAPPDHIEGPATIEALRAGDRFRFANHLRAWVDVGDDGRIVDHGQGGGGVMSNTTVKMGRSVTVAGVPLPDRIPDPEIGDGWVRFRQSAGGRTGVPAPRRVSHPPFVQVTAPLAWTTLELTLHADGRTEGRLAGASPFPRHWVYDASGTLVEKSGMIDFDQWYRHAFGKHSPWGDEDSPALTTEVETALERELSSRIMRGGRKPRIRTVKPGHTLVEQGEQGEEVFLLLDGVLAAEVRGESVAELGPGAVVGERASLEGGRRTATLRALTPCKVAVARDVDLEPEVLEELRQGHRREDQAR